MTGITYPVGTFTLKVTPMPVPQPSDITIEPVSLSPETAAQLSGVSVRTIYRLLADKAFRARRSGGRTLIDWASWRAYFTSLPDYVPGASMPNAPQAMKPSRRQRRRAS
jgi:excisionase family DNA binding protein